MSRLVKVAVGLAILGYAVVCGVRLSQVNYDQAVASGRQIPLVGRFAHAFRDTRHFISYYSRGGEPRWNSEAGFRERYVLTVQFPVELNWNGTRIASHGPPRFYFTEVETIEIDHGRAAHIHYASSKELSAAAAEALIASHGDVTVAGVPVKSAVPVEHFGLAWSQGGM